MKIKEINAKDYKKIIDYFDSSYIYQSVEMAKFYKKMKFKIRFIVFMENKKALATTLIIYKKRTLNHYVGFSPMAFVCSDDFDLNKALPILKEYLYENNFMTYTVNSNIIIAKRNMKDKIFYKNDLAQKNYNIFLKNGYQHKGFTQDNSGIIPRYLAEVEINADINTMFKNLKKNTRNKLRRATKYGVVVYKDNKCDFKSVFKFLDHYKNRPLAFYNYLKDIFKDNVDLYYAKLDTEKYVFNTRILYENQLKINDYIGSQIKDNTSHKSSSNILNKKIESDKVLNSYKKYMIEATELLKKYPRGLVIGAMVTVTYKNTIYLVSEGFDRTLPNLSCSYLMKWKVIESSIGTNIKKFNLGAIERSNDRLANSKMGFNATSCEYLGDFTLVINEKAYKRYKLFN